METEIKRNKKTSRLAWTALVWKKQRQEKRLKAK
jgi:hypothetical protein